jgi:hypothetical protein
MEPLGDISIQGASRHYLFVGTQVALYKTFKMNRPYDTFHFLLQSQHHFVTFAIVVPLLVINYSDIPTVKLPGLLH